MPRRHDKWLANERPGRSDAEMHRQPVDPLSMRIAKIAAEQTPSAGIVGPAQVVCEDVQRHRTSGSIVDVLRRRTAVAQLIERGP